jgi:anthranilate phosphoribosyltransferase
MPSIVPNGDDQNVYIVLDDFGRNGRAYRETDVDRADLEAVIMELLEGKYKNPARVVGFNTAVLRLPIYHPTFEEGLKSALREICEGTKSPELEDLDDMAPPGA